MDADGVRLQKVLAQAGVASRRAAERMIREGRVTVNGVVVTELGTRARPGTDRIAVDGRDVGCREHLVYLVLNKPAGYLSTARDTHGRPTVLDLVASRERLYPVGRLDADSEGLLLLTNDGSLAYAVTHPGHEVEKEYQVLVRGEPSRETIAHLRRGVEIEGGRSTPAEVAVLGPGHGGTWLRMTLREGRKRQIRRMSEAVGHPVIHLRRVRIGPVHLADLPPGRCRELSPTEVRALKGEDEAGLGHRH